jgi:hypothetical protein
VTCSERHDLILLYAAGGLEGGERDELRAHLAGGCPQCAGALAEAEAMMAQLPLALDAKSPPRGAKQTLLARIAAEDGSCERMKIGREKRDWDRIILPAALAAVLAVAVTLAAVWRFGPVRNTHIAAPAHPGDTMPPPMVLDALNKAMKELDEAHAALDQSNAKLTADEAELVKVRGELATAIQQKSALESMKFAELTGPAQPRAMGRVFIDTQKGEWYFFASGMKPPDAGKTYELWLIADDKKMPAGTFDVGAKGSAALLGAVPALSKNAAVVLAVTDEPMGPAQQAPTGRAQISGAVK